jgi:hypothetical protein
VVEWNADAAVYGRNLTTIPATLVERSCSDNMIRRKGMRGNEGTRRRELWGRRSCSLGLSSLMLDRVDMEVGVEADIIIDTMAIDTIEPRHVDTAWVSSAGKVMIWALVRFSGRK